MGAMDHYFFSIIPLKMKQMVSLANSNDLREIADICKERLKHSCVEHALTDLSNVEKSNADVSYELGEIRRKIGYTDARSCCLP